MKKSHLKGGEEGALRWEKGERKAGQIIKENPTSDDKPKSRREFSVSSGNKKKSLNNKRTSREGGECPKRRVLLQNGVGRRSFD